MTAREPVWSFPELVVASLSPLPGLAHFPSATHALRRGLHSVAASRQDSGDFAVASVVAQGSQTARLSLASAVGEVAHDRRFSTLVS